MGATMTEPETRDEARATDDATISSAHTSTIKFGLVVDVMQNELALVVFSAWRMVGLLAIAIAISCAGVHDVRAGEQDGLIAQKSARNGGVADSASLELTCRSDECQILELVVNCGQCKKQLDGRPFFPTILRFGQKVKLTMDCDPIEVVVDNGHGKDNRLVFTWEPE